MKTLTVGETFGFRGGLEQYCFQVANALSELGHSHILLHEQRSNVDEDKYRAAFEDVTAIPLNAGEAEYDRFLEDICAKHEPDVAVVHKSRNLGFIRALCRCLPAVAIIQDHFIYCLREVRYFPGSRKICTHRLGLHCLINGGFLGRPLRWGFMPAIHRLGPRKRLLAAHRDFDGVVVLSNHMKSELVLNGFDAARVDVVHGFTVPPEKEPPAPPPDSKKILFVGQVIRHKGVDVLLRAMAELPEDVRLTVVGEGGALDANKALAKELGLGGRVEFARWLNHDALEKHYRDTAVQVVSSVWAEPFGLVGLEAMARCRPVVAFDVGGISDWLKDGETGLLVKEISPSALAKAIGQILENREAAAEMGRKGRRWVAENFVPAVAGKKLEACLKKAIERGTAAGKTAS